MLYFFVFREENDMDEYLAKNVYGQLDPYAEVKRLEMQLKDDVENGRDTTNTKAKLVEMASYAQEGFGPLELALKRIEGEHGKSEENSPSKNNN